MKKDTRSGKELTGSGGTPRYIQIPCEERDILYLERVCMTPGLHTIAVASLDVGHDLVCNILQALNWHRDIALISTQQKGINIFGTNILDQIKSSTDQESMELFLLTLFNYDFLLIESTPELEALASFQNFQKLLIEHAIIKTLPVICMVRGK